MCSLGGNVNLSTVYNNESSLTCRVNQNQVHLCELVMPLVGKKVDVLSLNKSIDTNFAQISSSSSTGSENTTISIVWIIGSLRRHPIDLRTPVNSECILVTVLFI